MYESLKTMCYEFLFKRLTDEENNIRTLLNRVGGDVPVFPMDYSDLAFAVVRKMCTEEIIAGLFTIINGDCVK